jgi:hypothetical protein
MWIKVASSYLCALLILFGGASTQKKFPGKPTGPTINVDKDYEPKNCENNPCGVTYNGCGPGACDEEIGGENSLYRCHDTGQGFCTSGGQHGNFGDDSNCDHPCFGNLCWADEPCFCMNAMCSCTQRRNE